MQASIRMRNQCVTDAHTVMMVLFFLVFGWLCDGKKEKQLLHVWPVVLTLPAETAVSKPAIDSEMGSVSRTSRRGTLSLIPPVSDTLIHFPKGFWFFDPHQTFPLVGFFLFVCLMRSNDWTMFDCWITLIYSSVLEKPVKSHRKQVVLLGAVD